MFSQEAHRSFPAIVCWKEENNENISTWNLRKQIVRKEKFAVRIHGESAIVPEKKNPASHLFGPRPIASLKIDEDGHYWEALGDEGGSLL